MPPETLAALDKDELRPLVVKLVEQNGQLLGRIDDLLATNKDLLATQKTLLARIAELEAKQGQPPKTPTNSSLPPSRGQKANVTSPSGCKARRKGRPGVARELTENPDETRNFYAGPCACGTTVPPAGQTLAHAWDHIDIPPIKPVTTRINLFRAQCPCCKRRLAATPPADMAPGSPFGPGIVSIAAYLHGCHMVSYNRLVEVFDGLFGLKLSEGALANMLARTGKPFAAEADKIADIVRASPVIASDETSARVEGKTWWQWLFASASAVWHTIQPTRGKAVPNDFLGDVAPEVWISDRLPAQCNHAHAHQYCLAHLIRDAQYAIDAGDAVFAPAFKAFLKRACAIGRKRPELADATIARHARDLEHELDRLLDLKPSHAEGIHLQAAIRVDARGKLLVFMTRRDVEPTNNASERGLRPSVIFRKVTNGFRSVWGAKVYADFSSIVATGRLAGRSALASIRAVLAPATA
jgi:transposase